MTVLENNVDTRKRWGRAKAKLLGHAKLRPAVRAPSTQAVGVRHIAVCGRCGAFLTVEEMQDDAFVGGSAIEQNCDDRYTRGCRPAGES